MIGEIRDKETAATAMQLAFTGHLVMSSIHARSAAAIVYRLLDMGIEPYLLASVLDVLINQRLVRRLCQRCKLPVKPDKNIYAQLNVPVPRSGVIYEPHGCVECDGTGYAGRTGIFELARMTPELQDVMVKKLQQAEFEKRMDLDFTSLVADGMVKVAEGVTSLAEILRIVPPI
jgi:general secretion pathway protein E